MPGRVAPNDRAKRKVRPSFYRTSRRDARPYYRRMGMVDKTQDAFEKGLLGSLAEQVTVRGRCIVEDLPRGFEMCLSRQGRNAFRLIADAVDTDDLWERFRDQFPECARSTVQGDDLFKAAASLVEQAEARYRRQEADAAQFWDARRPVAEEGFVSELGWDLKGAEEPTPILLYDGEPHPDPRLHKLFMPQGEVCFLCGTGSSGKTFASLALALAVVTGKNWLGPEGFAVNGRGKVALLLAEEKARTVRQRLRVLMKAMGIYNDEGFALVQENLWVRLKRGAEQLRFIDEHGNQTAFFSSVKSRIARHRFSLIIADPASRLMGVESEVNAAHATAFVECMESLRELDGSPTVVVCHHVNKESAKGKNSGATAARGSSALTDAARWMILLEKDGQNVRLTNPKNNYGPEGSPRTITRDPVTGVPRAYLESTTTTNSTTDEGKAR